MSAGRMQGGAAVCLWHRSGFRREGLPLRRLRIAWPGGRKVKEERRGDADTAAWHYRAAGAPGGIAVILDQLAIPIVLAPLAGGPSTPQLTAEVSNAGGLGFLAAGYLTAAALGERLAQTCLLTSAPIGSTCSCPAPRRHRASPRRTKPAWRTTLAMPRWTSARRGSMTTTGRPRSTCSPRRRQRSCPSRSAAPTGP